VWAWQQLGVIRIPDLLFGVCRTYEYEYSASFYLLNPLRVPGRLVTRVPPSHVWPDYPFPACPPTKLPNFRLI
jgi:hypothetical protein